jgi:uncharacterized protein YccT (UPF0319 family)
VVTPSIPVKQAVAPVQPVKIATPAQPAKATAPVTTAKATSLVVSPAKVTAGSQPVKTAEPAPADSEAVRNLKFWYEEASPQERKQFDQWMKK